MVDMTRFVFAAQCNPSLATTLATLATSGKNVTGLATSGKNESPTSVRTAVELVRGCDYS